MQEIAILRLMNGVLYLQNWNRGNVVLHLDLT